MQPFKSDRYRSVLKAILLTLLAASPLGAGAANTDASASQDQLQEVLVSATRQNEQSVQQVPMAIAVISPASIDNIGLGSFQDLERLVPSVNTQSEGPGVNTIEMRGLVVNNLLGITDTQGTRSLVAIYLDDTPVGLQAINPDLHVYDLERIEVIKGPQGTLYGAGAMAGTIRMITQKPDTKQFFGNANASVSTTDNGGTNYNIRGMINLPLLDGVLGVRLTGYRSDDSGFINNYELGISRANASFSTQGRMAVRWVPTDALTIDASVTIEELNARGRYTVFPQIGHYEYGSLTPEPFHDNFKLYNLTAKWRLAFADFVSSSSYITRELTVESSFEYLNEAAVTPGYHLPSNNIDFNDIHSFTQEFRLVSPSDQKVHWIGGAYVNHFTRFFPQDVPTPGLDNAFATLYGLAGFNSQTLYGTPEPNDLFYGRVNIGEREYALFGEGTFPLLPKLDLTLGLRYFNFKEDFNLNFTGIAGAVGPGEPLVGSGVAQPSGVNPKGVLAYKMSDEVMLFGEAARGFRYGGVNEPAPISFCATALAAIGLKEVPESFGPDSIWSYSLGEKGTFASGRLLANATAFYIDWRDVQTFQSLSCGYGFEQNKGKVKSQGVEFETKAKVTETLTVDLSGSFTDARANGDIVNVNALDGERVPYFPRIIATVAATQKISPRIVLGADYTYRSSAYTEFNPNNPAYRQVPSSRMLNARITYEHSQWAIGLYGTNLTNDLLVSGLEPNMFGKYQPGDLWAIGRPRTIGINGRIAF